MLFGCARTIPSRRSGSLLRYREFQTVRGAGCLREQGILRGVMPPSVSIFFSFFLLTAAPKRRVRFGNERRNPENRAWRGVVVVRHFVALCDESDAPVGCSARKIADSGAVLRSRGSKALRQCRSQPVKVKGAGSQQG